MASLYQQRIAQVLDHQHLRGLNGAAFRPHHIEAYMRLEHSTLDGLAPDQFADEVVLACECVLVGGVAAAEDLARSFGLREG